MGADIGGLPDKRPCEGTGAWKHDALVLVRASDLGIPDARGERFGLLHFRLFCTDGGSDVCVRIETSRHQGQIA